MVMIVPHSLVNTNTIRKIKDKDTNEYRDVPSLRLNDGVEISCPCCGHRMNKNGFTNYVKEVFYLGSERKTTEYISQILICSNPNCSAKTKSGKNFTHVLLHDEHVPKQNLPAYAFDDAYTIHQHCIEWAKKNKEVKNIFNFIKNLKVRDVKKILKETTEKNIFYHRYRSDFFYFLKAVVIGKNGMKFYGYMNKLVNFFPGLLNTYKANLAAITKHTTTQTHTTPLTHTTTLTAGCQLTDGNGNGNGDYDYGDGGNDGDDNSNSSKLPNIFRTMCSHFVRTISILPKYSLAHIANTIPIYSGIIPNTG